MTLAFAALAIAGFSSLANPLTPRNEPDSVYLFSFSANNAGLRFAWSLDRKKWTSVGNGYLYVKSDWGRWGGEKKMVMPYLIPGAKGGWECVWQLNTQTMQFAHATSKDLVTWGPQGYPYQQKGQNVLRPVISYDRAQATYQVVYTDADGKFFRTATKDFAAYTPATEVPASAYVNGSETLVIDGQSNTGLVHRVSWALVQGLLNTYGLQRYKGEQTAETTKDDAQRFPGLKPVQASLVLQPERSKKISDLLTGIFFEDINYAADGGLYAELVQNRDFEYHPRDKAFRDAKWNATASWTAEGNSAGFRIDSMGPIHPNNPHYAVLDNPDGKTFLWNGGFDGIAVKKGEAYDFSVFGKQVSGSLGGLEIRLVSPKSGLLASARVNGLAARWKTFTTVLTASADAADARLELQSLKPGSLAVDMVSLFPRNTFKGHKNGLRDDLAKAIADIHPRFIRFPGGCVAHGDGMANIYKWKNSVGPLEARKPDRNIWNYHQSMGLGYFEYFQFCEDIAAEAVPVIAAGVPCQNSSTGGGGQQGGIPMSEMGAYIQDIIDLVEYANGSVNTVWGKKRAEAGHPKPFNLKYIGIGNEDQITDVFRERFEMIYKALRKAHPEITIIGTVGPFFEGTDYEEGWKIAGELKIPVVDEHYYQSPGWFINNQDYYDRYDRSKSKVYLGEYAASLPGGTKTNLETSLAEALYLTSLERNGDVVHMASYAPLLGKEGHTQWNPDLIYFNNTGVKPTIGYYVQCLYGQNAGDQYIPAAATLSNNQEAVAKRIAWSVVRDSRVKDDLTVKLVNILPVAVQVSIDLNGVTASAPATKTVLSGTPTDRTIAPVISETELKPKTTVELPPYSFTVIRTKAVK